MHALAHAGAMLLSLSGVGFVVLYILIAIGRIWSSDDLRDAGALACLGIAALTTVRHHGVMRDHHLQMPSLWLNVTVFVAGISAGLGLVVYETIGYALGSGVSWPLVPAERAALTLIHVTGASLVACGWYLQQRRRGFPLRAYFAMAVLVHAAWNGLLVSRMPESASVPATGKPDAVVVVAILVAIGLMLMLAGSRLALLIANVRYWRCKFSDLFGGRVVAPALIASCRSDYRACRINAISDPLSCEV